ncbi:MAG TPA: RNA polymerase sigma-70 factor [Flavisolibacter sp.]|jgi:RNA polymerase sigma-70 factor (ECF subfamily)|nr:RNA polymerase sigma-70 factor [Flavisolibacter sp.]
MLEGQVQDKRLLQLIAGGNESAFKTLFEKYRGKLYTYLKGITKSSEASEEIVMDVFLKIWIGRKTVTDIQHVDSFLFRIGHNKAIDFLRAVHRDQTLFKLVWEEIEVAGTQTADAPLKEKESQAILESAIARLSPKRRLVYELSRENALSHDQIAAYLNLSKSTVNNHLVESLRFIRHYLHGHLEACVLLVFLF